MITLVLNLQLLAMLTNLILRSGNFFAFSWLLVFLGTCLYFNEALAGLHNQQGSCHLQTVIMSFSVFGRKFRKFRAVVPASSFQRSLFLWVWIQTYKLHKKEDQENPLPAASCRNATLRRPHLAVLFNFFQDENQSAVHVNQGEESVCSTTAEVLFLDTTSMSSDVLSLSETKEDCQTSCVSCKKLWTGLTDSIPQVHDELITDFFLHFWQGLAHVVSTTFLHNFYACCELCFFFFFFFFLVFRVVSQHWCWSLS